MPKVKEAAVAVSGIIIDVETLKNFETKLPDGSMKYLISTGDGFASVKVQPRDALVVGEIGFGVNVAWIVRYGAYAQTGKDAQATCGFERLINEDDLDKLVSRVSTSTK